MSEHATMTSLDPAFPTSAISPNMASEVGEMLPTDNPVAEQAYSTETAAIAPESVPAASVEPLAATVPAQEDVPQSQKHWYVVKVQSGREDTIKEAILRRVRQDALEEFFGEVVIPVERVAEVKVDKNGKKSTKYREKKLYPGYLMVNVEYNDRIVYLFRETSGVGDFVGAHPGDLSKAPTPMSEKDVQKMIGRSKDAATPAIPVPPKGLGVGDPVRIVDGTFNGMEGAVKQILESQGKVQVELTIFGRPVDLDCEYHQIEQL
jgi:transcriptional antiterminator NusG